MAANFDDAEENASGSVDLFSSDLELVSDAGSDQTVGMRFNGIEIPHGATIAQAFVQFQADETSSEATTLTIWGEAVDNATRFAHLDLDLSSRTRTAAAVSWSPPAWRTVGEAGPGQQTPDIAPIIQEIVNRPGWAIENSLVVIITGSGRRVAESYDGRPIAAPLLHLEYIVSDQQPPTVDAGLAQTITLPNSASLDGTITDDGLPNPPGTVTVTWSQLSGPGTVTFADTTAVDTAASFSLAGTYILRLTAFDGERISRDEVTITVNPSGAPPTITSFTPASGQVASVVTVNGSNFSDAVAVAINGAAASFTVVSDNMIYATVPDAGTSGQISVTNGTGIGLSTTNFTVVASPSVLIGAGDIAQCSRSNLGEETAQLLDNIAGTVITLGDNVYPDGTESQFSDCYDPTWGRHKARIRPAPGNHDYHIPDAEGYFSYFGPAAGKIGEGYYSYDLGGWHIIVLNSECDQVGGCESNSPQSQWLQADLAANPSTCTLAYWHKPRFSSSSKHGSDTQFQDFWQLLYDAGADIVLGSHDHSYERFAPQDPNGLADPQRGLREFVVGTGGAGLHPFGPPEANSEVREDITHGVLKLTLHPTSYDWEFVPIAGQNFTDAGSGLCHQVNQVPSVNAGPDQTIFFPNSANLNGIVTDDGLPDPPGAVTTTWSQVSGPSMATFADASAVATTASFSEVGSYVLRLTADDGEFSASDEVTIMVVEEGKEVITVETRVMTGSDDAEESASGSVSLTSSDLELVFDGDDQTVGIRFNNVTVPQEATVVKAYVQFQVDETPSDPANLTIQGQAADNATTFIDVGGNISSRNETTAAVEWSPAAWPVAGQAGPDQQTPDISPIIEEIVNRDGWSSGNSLVILITGNGERVAESYNGNPNGAPLLHVEYSIGAPNDAPVAVDDAYTTDEDVPLNAAAPGVLGTDTDADGDPLTAVLVSDVSNGTLSLAPNGSFSYTPDLNFNGTDSFTYVANDGQADSNVATVT
ncbi:MAG: Ig-like domain-containing protein, partial [Anaerolineae bacterium]